MWNSSDEALVAGLANGDREAALRPRPALAGVRSRPGDHPHRGTAEEWPRTRQNAWRYAASYDPRGSVAKWLLSIARNAASTTRARDRRPEQTGTDVLTEVAGPVDVDSPYEDLALLRQAVRGLPEEQRAVLMAAVYHGFTTREISEAQHLPVGTVKTRLRLALGKAAPSSRWRSP